MIDETLCKRGDINMSEGRKIGDNSTVTFKVSRITPEYYIDSPRVTNLLSILILSLIKHQSYNSKFEK